MTASLNQLSANQHNRLSQRGAAFQTPPPPIPPGAYRRVRETKQPRHDNPSAPDIFLPECEYEINGYRQQQDHENQDRDNRLKHGVKLILLAFPL